MYMNFFGAHHSHFKMTGVIITCDGNPLAQRSDKNVIHNEYLIHTGLFLARNKCYINGKNVSFIS